jgi:peptidoglycan L-alanyl-D-glutamate endopeptidase CwlK
MASRDIRDLDPSIQGWAFILEDRFAAETPPEVDLLIYCTFRSNEEQARLYRIGRPLEIIQAKADELSARYTRPDLATLLLGVGPQHGPRILTYAGPGQSDHNYHHALDATPTRFGRAIWNDEGIPNEAEEDLKLWRFYGEIAKKIGFKWAGDWTKFQEYPHLYNPGCRWREMIAQC